MDEKLLSESSCGEARVKILKGFYGTFIQYQKDDESVINRFHVDKNGIDALECAIAGYKKGRRDSGDEKRKAPWKDYEGQEIYEGDVIIHPSNENGVVMFHPEREDPKYQWTVNYGGYLESSLYEQIGDEGRATVFRR